jgi:hypothetical protein
MSQTEFNSTKGPLILTAAGAGGGVLGFFLGEIQSIDEGYRFFADSLNEGAAVWFALVLLGIGVVLSASQGINEGNFQKAFETTIKAAPAFIVGGAISGFVAQSVYTNMLDLSALEDAIAKCPSDYSCSAIDNVYRPARAVGWMIAGGLGGFAFGLGFRSKKRAQNGLVGGLAGGLLGGLLFDSLDNITGISTEGSARLFGIVLIGTLIGALTGVLDTTRTEMWLTATSGEMSGQQFIIYDDSTIVGCARNIPITLMHDRDVAEHHIRIEKTSQTFTFMCLNNAEPIQVNGVAQTSGKLSDGDTIQIGNTQLVVGQRGTNAKGVAAQAPTNTGHTRPSLYSASDGQPAAEVVSPRQTTKDQKPTPSPTKRPSIQMKPKTEKD